MSDNTPRWAPDPYNPSQLRYWDGEKWTEHVGAAQTPSSQERPTSTAAFVCGIIGAIIGLIPLLGIFAIALGIIALVLGIIGWRRKPQRAKLAVVSTILGGVAIALGVLGLVIMASIFQEVEDTFNPNLDRSPNQPAEVIAEYGSDPTLDQLARDCAAAGENADDACADLWAESPVGSGYEAYGDSCGARPDRDSWTCLKD